MNNSSTSNASLPFLIPLDGFITEFLLFVLSILSWYYHDDHHHHQQQQQLETGQGRDNEKEADSKRHPVTELISMVFHKYRFLYLFH